MQMHAQAHVITTGNGPTRAKIKKLEINISASTHDNRVRALTVVGNVPVKVLFEAARTTRLGNEGGSEDSRL